MPLHLRPRRLYRAALTVALVAFVAACAKDHPDTIFHGHTEFNREVGSLFNLLIWLGTAVFVFVEAILVYALIRFRHREGAPTPAAVHGNTRLEILWTVIPAIILAVIAVPTVRTIFHTEAAAPAGALEVEVIGHQWWWEFKYPQYGFTTANELYLPVGRTVNFTLHSGDVIHSFWAPSMGGKRDVVTNHSNYLWYTPDSAGVNAWNGACAEYCGTSHANMRFKVFTVAPQDFAAWAAHQQAPAALLLPGQGTASAAPAAQQTPAGQTPAAQTPAATPPQAQRQPPPKPSAQAAASAPAPIVQAGYTAFPREQIPDYAVPKTPPPDGLTFDERLSGDPMRGATLLTSGQGACLGCHTIAGNPVMVGTIGPNLTHVASRSTIAGGLYPNDAKHMRLWIKNARWMKPGVTMPTIGLGQYDPELKATMKTGGLTDQQIADIVAYLQALK